MPKITYIVGVDADSAQKLHRVGIATTEALLHNGATPGDVEQIAARTGISGELIRQWVDQAGLFRIRGIGERYAHLLESVGVDTIDDLAQRTEHTLIQEMKVVNTDQNLVRRLPARSQVAHWIAQALDSLPGEGGTDNKP